MGMDNARWATWALALAPAALAAAHAGCTSVYDEYYKPLTATGAKPEDKIAAIGIRLRK